MRGKITILGCGTSLGCPQIANPDGLGSWGACNPDNPKNIRTRCSILVETGGRKILIDTSPDLRLQALRHNIRHLDSVLYTHQHADHILGIDELRAFCVTSADGLIDIYASTPVLEFLQKTFPYAFDIPSNRAEEIEYIAKPNLVAHRLDKKTQLLGLDVTPLPVEHGKVPTQGYLIGSMAYVPDVKTIPTDTFKKMYNLDVLILGANRFDPHPTHAHLELSLQWIDELKPKKAFLTNLGVELDYDDLSRRLPLNTKASYDGLEIEY